MAQAPPILIYAPGGGVPVGPVSNPPVYSQADTTQLIEGQAYVDVVFGSIQTDEDWVLVTCEVENTTDFEPLNIWPGIITDRTAAGFRLQLNGMPDSGNYYLHWAVSGVNIGTSPASTYRLTGPSSGELSVESTFRVALPPSTTVAVPVTVTPDDGGEGGTFNPSLVTLSEGSPSATFTYTPVSFGTKTISVTNSGILSDPAGIVFICVASTYTLSGPSAGTISVASTNFTVALPVDGVVIGTVRVTPSDGGGGGTFTPSTVNLTTAAPSATFTYTPASTGTKTLSVTNNGGLTDPANLSYAVSGGAYKRVLTVDHTKVPSTQTDFPVLVSITDATLKTIANGGHVQNANGYDIGFYSDSGLTTKLKWEVDRYDATTGELVAWVKIASLSSSSDTVFYLRYNDSAITTDQSDPVSVWSNSFSGIYHLGNGTTLNVNDSSSNAWNGTNTNGVTAVTGKIDGGGNFVQASTQYIDLGTHTITAGLTLSAWVKATSFPAAYNTVVSRTAGTSSQFFIKSTGKIAIYMITSLGSVIADGTGTNTLSTGVWYYLCATYDSTAGLKTYVNAGVDATAAANGSDFAAAAQIRIGSDAATPGREWNGVMDEVRGADVARSADWITTEYNNQNAPGTFITVGPEV